MSTVINIASYSFDISVLNCVRLLTRILPYIFEEPDWRGFFWSTLPGHSDDNNEEVTITLKYFPYSDTKLFFIIR